MPELLPPDRRASLDWRNLDIVCENVGFRPTRRSGLRVEVEVVTTFYKNVVPVIHCIGHGGSGFQSSWGSAESACLLLQGAVEKLNTIRQRNQRIQL